MTNEKEQMCREERERLEEHERIYLGSLLVAAEKGKIETRLNADDFEIKDYSRIFELILKQYRKGITSTQITLSDDLPDIDKDIIVRIEKSSFSDATIAYHESKIYEASKTRHFIRALQIAKEEIDGHTETDTVIKNLMPALAAVTTARNEAGIKSAAELINAQFPEIRWIIKGLIGEGLTLINGAPKIGKSWFVLNLAIAAASGGTFLGSLPAIKTDTLYLALEDTERRIHSRLKKLNAPATDNLKITTQWRDGYMGFENYLKTNIGIGLVIIDTLARFANIEDMNDYAITTNAMARLKRIADDLNIAIILIHHAKKTGRQTSVADWMEAALGSTGLTGATDSTIFISRKRDADKTENTATLYATGRDATDIKYSLKLDLDYGGWIITDAPKLETGSTPKNPGQNKSNGQRAGGKRDYE